MCVGPVTTKWKSASSIILASASTRRILMLKRGSTAAFMPNTLVFPGGVIDKIDAKLGEQFRSAAVRELFEESGILLTRDGQISSLDDPELSGIRARSADFEKLGKQMCVDRLVEWSTFLTPATSPKRFFTKFFFALLEDEPRVDLCTSEMSEYCWVDPDTCVRDAFHGKFTLPPPQVYELTRLAQIKDWTKCENYGNTKKVICPQPVKTKGEDQISNIFPGDYLYQENDSFTQPIRQLPTNEIAVRADLPTHRVTYGSKPIYNKCRVYQHNLSDQYQAMFHQFESHSKQLF